MLRTNWALSRRDRWLCWEWPVVCDSISSLLGAACVFDREVTSRRTPSVSLQGRRRSSRVWDPFRPVHLWMNAHVEGNLLAIVVFSPFLQESSFGFHRQNWDALCFCMGRTALVCLQPSGDWERKYWAEDTGKVSIRPYLSASLTHPPVLRLCNPVAVLGKGLLEASWGKVAGKPSEPRGTRLGLGRRL